MERECTHLNWILCVQRARNVTARGCHICKNYLILSIFEQVVIGQLNTVQGTYLRVRSAGTIRAITSLPWMLQCQRSVIIKVLDPPISNENRAHWGMNPSKWSINYETFPSHKGRKLLASLVPGSTIFEQIVIGQPNIVNVASARRIFESA